MNPMDAERFSVQQMRLRAFDLSERTLQRSRASAVRRVDRLRGRAFMIGQCAVTAALAWFLAGLLPGHKLPFFAPVASIITLGISFGARLRRAIEVAAGVSVGVAVGELWSRAFGTGVWQIAVVCALAMSLATLVGAGQLMIIQAGVQSITVTVLSTNVGYGVNRWLDALIGCMIALLMATIAPGAALRRPGLVAGRVLTEVAATLDAATAALRGKDEAAAFAVLDRARAGERDLAAFDQAAAEGLGVVRHSPFRRGQAPAVEALADLHDPLDHLSRNLRVLARRCAIAIWRGHSVPEAYLDLLEQLAEVCRFMADELNNRRLPVRARDRLVALGQTSSHLPLSDSLSAVVILAQARSMIADLLELAGLDYAAARDLIPDVD